MINIDDRILSQVDPGEMWLLLHLAKRLNKNRACWPSNKILCDETGWHIEKLQKVKKSLVEKGLLTVVERKYSNGVQGSNYYQVTSEFVSVFVTLKDLGEIPENPTSTPSKTFFDPPGNSDNIEVLTNEVLINKGIIDNVCTELIERLNEIRGIYGIQRREKPTRDRVKLIKSRLIDSGYSSVQIVKMFEHRCKVWKGSEFEKYIQIETLFRASKFTNYMEQSEAQPEQDWTERETKGTPATASDNQNSGLPAGFTW